MLDNVYRRVGANRRVEPQFHSVYEFTRYACRVDAGFHTARRAPLATYSVLNRPLIDSFRFHGTRKVRPRQDTRSMLGLKRAMRIRYLILLSVASIALIAWLYVFVVAFVRGRRISECPRCRSDRVRPAWPRLVDKLLRFSFVTPYRCEACRRRFYARR